MNRAERNCNMRIVFFLAAFVGSFLAMMIACTWLWDGLVNNQLYHCTDGGTLDFLNPGDWTHNPVEVSQITVSRSMSEPDTIKAGWTVKGLWWLWSAFVAGALLVSFLIAWFPWIPGRSPAGTPHCNSAT
jgi:hypothetical protein